MPLFLLAMLENSFNCSSMVATAVPAMKCLNSVCAFKFGQEVNERREIIRIKELLYNAD